MRVPTNLAREAPFCKLLSLRLTPFSACALTFAVLLVLMNDSSTACAFPSGTRFFSLDGTLFAHTLGDDWYTVNASGTLVKLDVNNSPANAGIVFTGDRISEPEFLAALAGDTTGRAMNA